jgi:predicted nucleotidyltransferase
MEWLASPVVYREAFSLAGRLRELREAYYLPFSCLHHYLSMASRHVKWVLGEERIKTKHYFYMLRPLLAVDWIERGYGVAPTAFGDLLERLVTEPVLKAAIVRMIQEKRLETEKDTRPPEPLIQVFIEREMARLQDHINQYAPQENPAEQLDELFRATLREVWAQR